MAATLERRTDAPGELRGKTTPRQKSSDHPTATTFPFKPSIYRRPIVHILYILEESKMKTRSRATQGRRLDPYRDIDLVEAGDTVALESVALVQDVASAASGYGATAAVAGAFAFVASAACAAIVVNVSLGGFVLYLSPVSVAFVAYVFVVAETSAASAVSPSKAVGIES